MTDTKRWTAEAIKEEVAKWTGEGSRDPAAERRRLRIVQAATELFVRQGYRKTSVDEIARHAGIAKGTVYLYAKTKADLLVQAMVEEKRRWADEIAAVLSGEVSGRERMRRYVRGSVLLSARMPLVSRLLRDDRDFLGAMDELDPAVRAQSERQQMELTCEFVREAASPDILPPDVLQERARALIALLTSVKLADVRVREGMSLERYADQVADIIVNGVGSPPGMKTGETP